MPYNYSKLLGRITEFCGNQAKFAHSLGLSARSVSLKLNGKIGWKQSEIAKACEILRIKSTEIGNYFFTL